MIFQFLPITEKPGKTRAVATNLNANLYVVDQQDRLVCELERKQQSPKPFFLLFLFPPTYYILSSSFHVAVAISLSHVKSSKNVSLFLPSRSR